MEASKEDLKRVSVKVSYIIALKDGKLGQESFLINNTYFPILPTWKTKRKRVFESIKNSSWIDRLSMFVNQNLETY